MKSCFQMDFLENLLRSKNSLTPLSLNFHQVTSNKVGKPELPQCSQALLPSVPHWDHLLESHLAAYVAPGVSWKLSSLWAGAALQGLGLASWLCPCVAEKASFPWVSSQGAGIGGQSVGWIAAGLAPSAVQLHTLPRVRRLSPTTAPSSELPLPSHALCKVSNHCSTPPHPQPVQ